MQDMCYNTPMNGENPIVLVDMDGVLADFDGATQAHLESLRIYLFESETTSTTGMITQRPTILMS